MLYISTKTYQSLATYIKQSIPTACLRLFEEPITLGDVEITPIEMSHDALACVTGDECQKNKTVSKN
jgi:hypothetical protein